MNRSTTVTCARTFFSNRRRGAALLTVGLTGALVTGACGGSGGGSAKSAASGKLPPGPSCIKDDSGKRCLPLAQPGKRVDLTRPKFSNPTSVTNPLHPTSKIAQVIYGGQVDGKPFRTEFSLLPDIKTVSWDGRQVKTITVQYLAFSDGRIQEIATDSFAQADDGSVWYFGEDVADYKDGVIYTHEGTWHAGKDAPAALIMAPTPTAGQVWRTENAPGIAFEEITVKSTGQTVFGPSGPINGTINVSELHTDNTREDKIFAPGYGEFSTGTPTGDLERASLAVPTDTRPGPPPAALNALSAAIRKAYDAVGKSDWAAATTTVAAVQKAWAVYRPSSPHGVLETQMSRDIDTLATAIAARRSAEARGAALRVAQNDLDQRLRYQPVVQTDLARLDLWARQIVVDAATKDAGSVAGDVATLELTRDRVRRAVDPAGTARLDAALRDLRRIADAKDIAAAAKAAPALQATIAALQPK
jgi:hypothetical protein